MSLTLITGPVQEPITIAQAKAQLRLDVDTDDELVRDLIITAREWVEGQTHRCLVAQTFDQTIDYEWPFRRGTYRIDLEKNPVASVTSITYVDGSSPNPTLAASQYSLAARKYGSFIVPAYGVTWPTVRTVPAAITVRFIAGNIDTLPKPLEQAMKLLVTHLYENRETVSSALEQIPYTLESMISPYRS